MKYSRKVSNQSLVGFDPSIVSQIGQFLVRAFLNRSVRSPFVVGFVSVMNKSFVRRRKLLISVKRRLF